MLHSPSLARPANTSIKSEIQMVVAIDHHFALQLREHRVAVFLRDQRDRAGLVGVRLPESEPTVTRYQPAAAPGVSSVAMR